MSRCPFVRSFVRPSTFTLKFALNLSLGGGTSRGYTLASAELP